MDQLVSSYFEKDDNHDAAQTKNQVPNPETNIKMTITDCAYNASANELLCFSDVMNDVTNLFNKRSTYMVDT